MSRGTGSAVLGGVAAVAVSVLLASEIPPGRQHILRDESLRASVTLGSLLVLSVVGGLLAFLAKGDWPRPHR